MGGFFCMQLCPVSGSCPCEGSSSPLRAEGQGVWTCTSQFLQSIEDSLLLSVHALGPLHTIGKMSSAHHRVESFQVTSVRHWCSVVILQRSCYETKKNLFCLSPMTWTQHLVDCALKLCQTRIRGEDHWTLSAVVRWTYLHWKKQNSRWTTK